MLSGFYLNWWTPRYSIFAVVVHVPELNRCGWTPLQHWGPQVGFITDLWWKHESWAWQKYTVLSWMKLMNLRSHFFCLCFKRFARHKRAQTSNDNRTVPWCHRPAAPCSVLSPRWPELWKPWFIGEEGKVSDLSVSNSATGLLRLTGCCCGRMDGTKLPARACRDQHFIPK